MPRRAAWLVVWKKLETGLYEDGTRAKPEARSHGPLLEGWTSQHDIDWGTWMMHVRGLKEPSRTCGKAQKSWLQWDGG